MLIIIPSDLDTLDSLMSQVSKTGKDVELQDVFFRFTLSSFATIAFSADVECLSSDPAALDIKVPFAAHFDYAQKIMDQRITEPWQTFFEKLWVDNRLDLFAGQALTLIFITATPKDARCVQPSRSFTASATRSSTCVLLRVREVMQRALLTPKQAR